MPEGPEVKIMTDNFSKLLLGKRLVSAKVFPGYVKKANLTGLVLGQKVVSVGCRGKFTYIQLEDGGYLGVTYGMSGCLRLSTGQDAKSAKHNAVEFVAVDDLGLSVVFYFNDIRHFGSVIYYPDRGSLQKKLNKIGVDLLGELLLTKQDVSCCWRSCRNICVLLMDQELISGIGNYLKCEALYKAGIPPQVKGIDLTEEKLYQLYLCAREVALAAYQAGGASLYTYTGMEGDRSPFKGMLAVYDRVLDPLGNPVLRLDSPDGRTTHWVPAVQVLKKKLVIVRRQAVCLEGK